MHITESYFVLKIVANHQKCQSCQVCQVNSSEKLMDESLFFRKDALLFNAFPLDFEWKFHIACKAENPIKIDGNPFKF